MNWMDNLPAFVSPVGTVFPDYTRDQVFPLREQFNARFSPILLPLGFRLCGHFFLRIHGENAQLVGFQFDHRTRSRLWMECDAYPVFQIYADKLMRFGPSLSVSNQHPVRGGDRWPATVEEFVQFRYPGSDGTTHRLYDQLRDFNQWLDCTEALFTDLAIPALDRVSSIDEWINHSRRVHEWQDVRFEPEIALILALFDRGHRAEAVVQSALLVARREHWLRREKIKFGEDANIVRHFDKEFQPYRDFHALLVRGDGDTVRRWIDRAYGMGLERLKMAGIKVDE